MENECYTMLMKLEQRHFTIVERPDELSKSIKTRIERALEKSGYVQDAIHPEIVIVIGGDGTFIYAIHQYIERLNNVYFYGLHTGTLGFYTDFRDCEEEEFLNCLLEGRVREFSYPLLRAVTDNETYYAVNEVRVENAVRTQDMSVYVNDRLFEEYRGTGMCVATQLGSTAYNRSLGGAVIQEGLDTIEMCEISGIHHNKYRSLNAPFVMHASQKITFVSKSFKGALLGVDSEVYSLDAVNRIDIEIAKDKKVKMYRGKEVSYFDRLQSLF